MVAHQQNRLLVMNFGVFAADIGLSDPVDVPAFVSVKGDVVLVSTCIETRGAVIRTPAQVDHHTPPPP
jgi:hypothetical protein